jgi:hypothetical protein
LTLSHLPNGDILLQQWNIKSWHHSTRKMSEYRIDSLALLTPHIGEVVSKSGEPISGLCLRAQT